MSEKTPSIIRAPPDALTTTSGISRFRAFRPVRAIFSPTTEPIEPPIKLKSITAKATGMPSIRPLPVVTASFRPVLRRAASSRCG